MPAILPETSEFRTAVYGTVFANRAAVVQRLHPGDPLILVADPPGIDEPSVWVHAVGGDVIGHLSSDLNSWLVPWMLAGHRCRAVVARVGGSDVASWKRLVIAVTCERREAGTARREANG
jgi:hypothetical protein